MNSRRYLFLAFLIVGYTQGICQAVDMAAVKKESCASLDESLEAFENGNSYGIFSLVGGRRRDLWNDLQFCGKDTPMQWRGNMTRRLVDLFNSLDDEDGLTTVARKRNIIEMIGAFGRGPQVEEFFLKLFEYPNGNYRDTLLRFISPTHGFSDAVYNKIKEKGEPWKIKKTLLLHYLKDANPQKVLPELQEAVRQTTSHKDYYYLAGMLCKGYPLEAMDPLMDKYDDMLYVVAKDLSAVKSYRHPSSGFIQCEKDLMAYAQYATGARRRAAIEVLKRQHIIDKDIKAKLEELFPEDFVPAPPAPAKPKPPVKKSITTITVRNLPVRYTLGRDRELNSSDIGGISTAAIICGGKTVFEQFYSSKTTSVHLTPRGLPYGSCVYSLFSFMGQTNMHFYNVQLEAEIPAKSFRGLIKTESGAFSASLDLELKSGEGLRRVELIEDGALVWAKPIQGSTGTIKVVLKGARSALPRNYLIQVVDMRGVYLQKYFTLNEGNKEGSIELVRKPDNRGRLVPAGRNVRVDLNSGIYMVFDEVYASGEITFGIQNSNPYYPVAGEVLQEQPVYEIQPGGLLRFNVATITFPYNKAGLSQEQEEGQQISRLIPASAGGPLERYKAKVDTRAGTVAVAVKSLGNFVRTMPAFKKAYVAKSSRLVKGLPELEVYSDRKIDIVESPRVPGDMLSGNFHDTYLLSAFYTFSPAGVQLEPSGKIVMRYDPAKLPVNAVRCPPAIRRTGNGWRKVLTSAPPTEQSDYLENTSEIVYMACSDSNPSRSTDHSGNE